MAEGSTFGRARVRSKDGGWLGRVWRPHPVFLKQGETDFQFAVRIGVCADSQPDGDPVLVQWDDRPGVIQAHTWKELEVIDDDQDERSPR